MGSGVIIAKDDDMEINDQRTSRLKRRKMRN
jgi:hypothetical protein